MEACARVHRRLFEHRPLPYDRKNKRRTAADSLMDFPMAVAVRRLIVLMVGFSVALSSARSEPPPDLPPFDPDMRMTPAERDRRVKAVEVAHTAEDVLRLIGPPDHVARQILFHRTVEQWFYDGTFSLRLQFDCLRGQEPRLQSVQSGAAPGK
ncbi:MAG TPA: hypothetical protein VMS17_30255 [Gemmataceae bacterium]|nr:hypothetical protein [Gemmataceae bacterium]